MPAQLKEREVSMSRNKKHRVAAVAAEEPAATAGAPAVAPAAAVKALVFPIASGNRTDKLRLNVSSPHLTVTVVTTFLMNGKHTCQKYTGSTSGLITPIGIQATGLQAAHRHLPLSLEAATATAAAVTAAAGKATRAAPVAVAAVTIMWKRVPTAQREAPQAEEPALTTDMDPA